MDDPSSADASDPKQFEERISNVVSHSTSLSHIIVELVSRCDALQKRCEDAEASRDAARAQSKAAPEMDSATLAAQREEVKRLHGDLAAASALASGQADRIKTLEARCETVSASLSKAEAARDAALESAKARQDAAATSATQLTRTQAELATANEQVTALTTELASVKALLKEKEQAVADAKQNDQQRATKSRESLSKARDIITDLRQQNAKLQAQITTQGVQTTHSDVAMIEKTVVAASASQPSPAVKRQQPDQASDTATTEPTIGIPAAPSVAVQDPVTTESIPSSLASTTAVGNSTAPDTKTAAAAAETQIETGVMMSISGATGAAVESVTPMTNGDETPKTPADANTPNEVRGGGLTPGGRGEGGVRRVVSLRKLKQPRVAPNPPPP